MAHRRSYGPAPRPFSAVESPSGRAARLHKLAAVVEAELREPYRPVWNADGTILLVPAERAAASPVDHEWDAELERVLWRMRALHLSRRESRYLLTDLDTPVTWPMAMRQLEALAVPASVAYECQVRGEGICRTAACPLPARVAHLYRCRAVPLPDLQQPGHATHTWLNIALDATSRWVGGSTHIHCTLGFDSRCSTLASWWLAEGSEKWGTVWAVARHVGFDGQLRELERTPVPVHGTERLVLPFLCADGKAQVFMAGCDDWKSKGVTACICWACGGNRATIMAAFGRPAAIAQPLVQGLPPTAIMRPIPPCRRIPDFGLHGVCRVCICGLQGMIRTVAAVTGKATTAIARCVQEVVNISRLAARTASRSTLRCKKANAKGTMRLEASAASHFMRGAGWARVLAV